MLQCLRFLSFAGLCDSSDYRLGNEKKEDMEICFLKLESVTFSFCRLLCLKHKLQIITRNRTR